MSNIIIENSVCAYCGKESNQFILLSTNASRFADLDTRPNGAMRGVLQFDLQICPHCGYVNEDIRDKYDFDINTIVNSDSYKKILDSDIGDSIKKFLLAAEIYKKIDNRKAGVYFLNAAWLFDDGNDVLNAEKMRLNAREYLTAFVNESGDVNIGIMLVDINRRVKDFDKAIGLAQLLIKYGVDDYKNKILNYQISLCNDKDDKIHSLDEVV